MRRLSSNRRASLISKAFHSLPMPKRQSVADDLALLIDVEEDESIGEANSDVFDDHCSDDDGHDEG